MKWSTQVATQLDKTPVPVLGEIHVELSYGNLNLPLDALVVDVLDTDILLGVPFCVENDVSVYLRRKVVDIQGVKISYDQQPRDIRSKNGAMILPNTVSTVVYPGEFLELQCGDIQSLCDGEEVMVEPHLDSPDKGMRLSPIVSCIVNSSVRVPNNTEY